MKYFLPLILISILIIGCKTNQESLTPEQLSKEKEAVVKTCKDYNKAAEQKSWSSLVETLADSVMFFGTDSSEVTKTYADFKKAIEKQWQVYNKVAYGDISDVFIQMDKHASIASIIFGVPCVTELKDGTTEHFYLRVARTLRKERGKWLIVSGISGIARSDTHPESSQTQTSKENEQDKTEQSEQSR